MTIIGETYQINGTVQHAYCRSNKLIPIQMCYLGVDPGLTCIDENNILQFLSYSGTVYGLSRPNPVYVPAYRFMCE
jgi:hypothetical protein